MGERTTIGLIYSYDENWIAGTYYIENLVNALKRLPVGERPSLKIYCNSHTDFQELQFHSGYPDLHEVLLIDKNTLMDKVLNKISFLLFQKHWIARGIDNDVDLIFPNPTLFFFGRMPNKLFWIPDFQEVQMPHFFSEAEIQRRTQQHWWLEKQRLPVVFSSKNAKEDFLKIFPTAKNKIFVMPFAVTHPTLEGIDGNVIEKYGLPQKFFICSNQFWQHKNHSIVLEAITILKDQMPECNVVFTGKPKDFRNPDYFNSLTSMVEKNGLEKHVKFLGFIDRKEQLALMKKSQAIIQPSLFEGWSTVVEDAKALNHPVIMSDIAVHREQLPDSSYFFQPKDAGGLANLMKLGKWNPPAIRYENEIEKFGKQFMSIAQEIIQSQSKS